MSDPGLGRQVVQPARKAAELKAQVFDMVVVVGRVFVDVEKCRAGRLTGRAGIYH